MNRASAEAIFQWRYEPPYDVYNLAGYPAKETIAAFLEPDFAYYQINDRADTLVAFCNFGVDARVPGGDYSEDALDIGLGVSPDLTGVGRGSSFVKAVLAFALQAYQPSAFRVTIAEFNKRAQRVWINEGFILTQQFQRSLDGAPFLIFTKKADRRTKMV